MKYYPKVKEIQLKYKKIIAKFTFTLLTTSFTAMGSSGDTPQSSCFSMVYIRMLLINFSCLFTNMETGALQLLKAFFLSWRLGQHQISGSLTARCLFLSQQRGQSQYWLNIKIVVFEILLKIKANLRFFKTQQGSKHYFLSFFFLPGRSSNSLPSGLLLTNSAPCLFPKQN